MIVSFRVPAEGEEPFRSATCARQSAGDGGGLTMERGSRRS